MAAEDKEINGSAIVTLDQVERKIHLVREQKVLAVTNAEVAKRLTVIKRKLDHHDENF